MRENFAKLLVVVVLVGLASMGVRGCKRQIAPAEVQQVARPVSQVQPDFPEGPLPVVEVDPVAAPRVDTAARRRQPQVEPQAQSADAQAAAVAAEQRRQDARLLQQQQASSQRQQQELNQEIQQNLKTQQEVQAEPRIQDAPGTQAPPASETGQPQP